MSITATKSPRTCRGFNLKRHPIFTGFSYKKIFRGKSLCDDCCEIIAARKADNKFWADLINEYK